MTVWIKVPLALKANKKGFLYIGEQGGRYKAMFKLHDSILQADKLAAQDPERFQAGKAGWVTARFTAEEPMPQTLWEQWLDESYKLCFARKSSSKRKPQRG